MKHNIAVGVVEIPISLERVMTHEEKIAKLKTPNPVAPPRVTAKVSFGDPVAVFKFLPDANDKEFSDGSADGIPADDDDSTASHIKRAQNHLEMVDEDLCRQAPTDGSPDHMSLAVRHIQEALEMRARGQRRADADIMSASRVKFVN
jgi:hypothetical protein